VREQIAERLAGHRYRLRLYQRIADTIYRDVPNDDPATVGRLLGLRAGLAYEQAWIRWCTDALQRLDPLLP